MGGFDCGFARLCVHGRFEAQGTCRVVCFVLYIHMPEGSSAASPGAIRGMIAHIDKPGRPVCFLRNHYCFSLIALIFSRLGPTWANWVCLDKNRLQVGVAGERSRILCIDPGPDIVFSTSGPVAYNLPDPAD